MRRHLVSEANAPLPWTDQQTLDLGKGLDDFVDRLRELEARYRGRAANAMRGPSPSPQISIELSSKADGYRHVIDMLTGAADW